MVFNRPLPLFQNEFYSQVNSNTNQTHFHKKGFTLGLVLKQRQKATREWPIVACTSPPKNNVLLCRLTINF